MIAVTTAATGDSQQRMDDVSRVRCTSSTPLLHARPVTANALFTIINTTGTHLADTSSLRATSHRTLFFIGWASADMQKRGEVSHPSGKECWTRTALPTLEPSKQYRVCC